MFQKTVLDNGIRVISERVTGVRTVAFGVWVAAGSRDEHDLNAGAGHYIEHMLFKGTGRRDAGQIAREFDILGGTGNGFTTREHTCFHATVLDRELPQLIDLLADMVLASRFDGDEVVRERQVILQEIAMAEDDAADNVHDLFCGLLFGSHPLGRPVLGTREAVAAMDRRKLLDHMARGYVPERLVLSAAGNVDHRELVNLCRRTFGAMVPASGATLGRRLAPPPMRPRRRTFSRDLEQVHVVLGCRTPPATAPERHGLTLLNTILGANMSSRLFQAVREERGLAYSVYSYLDGFDDCGILAVYLGVDRATLAETLDLVGRELARLTRDPVPAEELERAVRYSRAGLYLAAESMEERMVRNARNEFSFGTFVPYEEEAAGLEAVTAEDLLLLSRSLFHGPVSAAVVGPVVAAEVEWGAL